jgi:uncharacterized protein
VFETVFILIIGLISGFLGGIVGGGGMITIPALIAIGIPPQVAIATNKIGDVGTFSVAVKEYYQAKKINFKIAALLSIFAVVGSFIGAGVMAVVDSASLAGIIGIVILVALPFLYSAKGAGIKRKSVSSLKKHIGMVVYFCISIISAMLGAGTGTIALLAMVYFFGMTFRKGYGTIVVPELILSLIPAVIYFSYGFVNIEFAIVLLIGNIIGSFIGARTALKKGDLWVKHVFTVVVILLGVKILFF